MLTARQQQILIAAYRDLIHWRNTAPRDRGQLVGSWAAEVDVHNYRIAAAAAGFVEIRAAAWLGRTLTASDRVSNSYAYAALEAAGLIRRGNRHGDYGQRFRAHHFEFTPEGERVAAQLTITDSAGAVADAHVS